MARCRVERRLSLDRPGATVMMTMMRDDEERPASLSVPAEFREET
jgi:hypothetical protein